MTINNIENLESGASVRGKLNNVISEVNSLGTAANADIGDFATSAQGTLADTAVQPSDLSTVATTNNYNDLNNLPSLGSISTQNSNDVTITGGSITGTAITGNLTGNASTATALETARTLTIGSTGKTFDGTANVSWSLSEIGVGTLGQQNSNSVTITGGTINGTSIGATTASTGAFTTLTTTGDVTIPDRIIHAGDTNTQIRFPANDTVTIETDGAERMRIDASGNVGIGTSSPNSVLHLFGNTGTANIPRIKIEANGWSNDCRIERSSGSDGFYITNNYDTSASASDNSGVGTSGLQLARGFAAFHTGSSGAFNERLRITSTGNVGIGTSSPSAELDVATLGIAGVAPVGRFHSTGNGGAGRGTKITIGAPGSANAVDVVELVGYQNSLSTTANNAAFGINVASGGTGTLTERMRIDASGNVGIGTSSPASKTHISSSVSGFTAPLLVENTNTGTVGAVAHQIKAGTNTAVFGIRGSGHNDPYAFLLAQSNVPLLLGTNDTERMRIDSSGNVGIGTSNPSGYLSVSKQLVINGGSSPSMLQLNNTTTGEGSNTGGLAIIQQGDNAFLINPQSTGTMRFFTNNTERMRIDASGNLLVGTTSVDPIADASNGMAFFRASSVLRLFSSVPCFAVGRSVNGQIAQFFRDTTQVGNISVTTTATSYNTSSDHRLKEDVQPMVGASDRVLALNPVNFAWKVDGTRVDGFLAHEAQAIVPEAVTGEKDGEEMQAIDQSKLVPLLTAALQEALKRIEALEAKLNP